MYLKINNVIDPLIKGVFSRLHSLYPSITWLDDNNVKSLDLEYVFNHSGNKYVSNLFSVLLNKEKEGTITSALDEVVKIIYLNNFTNWRKKYEAYNISYNPLENYNMVENEKVKSKITNSVGSDSGTYGFNSDTSVPTGKVNSTSITEGSKDDNDRDLTRSGNIGVTTSQQMLEAELSLRKYKFFHEMMKDIDKILCLKVY